MNKEQLLTELSVVMEAIETERYIVELLNELYEKIQNEGVTNEL